MTADDLAALKRQLTSAEARTTYLYDDKTGKRIVKGSVVKGHPTWGIGFNTDATPFCEAAIDAQFDDVLTKMLAAIQAALPWFETLPTGPMRALVDVAWNAGVNGLLGFHQMLAAAEAGDFNTAAMKLLPSNIAPARVARLQILMRS